MMSFTHIYKHIVFAVLAVMTLLLYGCQKEELEIADIGSPTEYFTFIPSIGNNTKATSNYMSGYIGIEEQEWELTGVATKAALVNSFDGLDAGVTGYVFESSLTATSKSWTEATNKKYKFEDNALVADGDYVRWVSVGASNKVRIYAYAPYMELNVTQYTGAPVINYTLPEKAENQKDILVAVSSDYSGDYRKTIPLKFQHCLTAVRFRAGFDCNVKKVEIKGVYESGTYTIGNKWSGAGNRSFVVDFGTAGKAFADDELINDGKEILMLIPQVLGTDASIVLTYDDSKTISASLSGFEFKPGKLVTFTLNKEIAPDKYIYFDLAAGDVSIGYEVNKKGEVTDDKVKKYTGYVYVNGNIQTVTGTHSDANLYYVYQSTGDTSGAYDKTHTGWTAWDSTNNKGVGVCRIPSYSPVMGGLWGDYITDNTVVEDVIHKWGGTSGGNSGEAASVGRTVTNNRIHVSGNLVCNLTIDDIYSNFQINSQARASGGLAFVPNGSNSKLLVNIVGDNRLGCVHYNNANRANQLVFEGIGTLTVADADYNTTTWNSRPYIGVDESFGDGVKEVGEGHYVSNHWNAAIGNSDSANSSVGIIINSGVIFAGTTKAENCTAIGAGGNGLGVVIINGGTVTAVASTTGTAIGGGIGFNATGGQGEVTIRGGNVYAYNHPNRWDIPSAAIGGAGSSAGAGDTGTVTITGGNVYAVSALGTAIGGGSSQTRQGGAATVTISGGNVIAKSIGTDSGLNPGKWIEAGSGIGGGTGCSGGECKDSEVNVDGGMASITISGNAIIRTGSIGGGKSGHLGRGKIGAADILVEGGDIQAQFIMAAGSAVAPKFEMTEGIIRDSNVDDPDYSHISRNGGAVYMESGSFIMRNGIIKQCVADNGGAVYIKAGDERETSPQFTMYGGQIFDCTSNNNGGAIYLEDGGVTMAGGSISNCSAEYGGAIYILKTGAATPTYAMSGGSVQTCNSLYDGGGIYLEGGNATLTGGSIKGNYASAGNGGGMNIKAGNLFMAEDVGKEIEIVENSAQMHEHVGGSGGGIYVSSDDTDVNVKLISGTVMHNASNYNGGGIAVVMSDLSTASADVTVGITDGDDVDLVITQNDAANMGGGLYVIGSNAQVTINSGSIADNNSIAYTYNEDVANEKGTVTLNGGDVASVNVIFHSNAPDAYFNDNKTLLEVYQRIVTSTNSRLVLPAKINRPGYTFVGWHSHRDGDDTKGREYKADDIMNLSSSIDLYALWEMTSNANQ